MSDPLPERPDLDQLRRRAKELRDAARQGDATAEARFARHHRSPLQGEVSLAAAQLVIARESGFPSWPKLKAAIEAEAASRQAVSAFAAASVEGRMQQARELLRADPEIAGRSLLAASVLGDVDAARRLLEADPAAAVALDAERGWPPLLYACYSRWHQIEPGRAPAMAEVVRLLLSAGASANTNDGGRPQFRSALKGSVDVDNPDITEVLLDAGANPDMGQPIGEAAGHRRHRCLKLLLSHGARVTGTWAVGAATYADDPVAMSLLLDSLETSGGADRAAHAATRALPEAAAIVSLPVIVALLDAGANPQASDGDGVSALRHAVRAGKNDIAAHLRAQGADDDGTDVDRFIGACLNGDRRTAERLRADDPGLSERLTEQDQAVIVDAAGSRPPETLALMLDLGLSPHTRNDLGEQPLHNAAYFGNAAAVRLLLDAGADTNARDTRFDATPLAYATVGSGEQADEPGDWIETIRLLLDAGASQRDVWVKQKPPSEQVADFLRRHGITPDDEPAAQPTEPRSDDQPEYEPSDRSEPSGSIGTGVPAEIARHIEAAYRERDLDLLASLLHPDVHWTGVCQNSAEVIDWYRGLLAEGMTSTVRSVEVDHDAVVLGLAVSRQAEGVRPAPPQQLYQVLTIDGAQIIDIRAYPDRRSALARS